MRALRIESIIVSNVRLVRDVSDVSDVLPLSLRSRAELDLNFITITIAKAMITKPNTTAISMASTGLKLSCHTLPVKTKESDKAIVL